MNGWRTAWVIGFWASIGCSSAPVAPPGEPPTSPRASASASASTPAVQAAPSGVLALPDWRAEGGDWSLLDRVFEGRSVVLLGESLHLTRELPRVRLPIVRRLHEQLGFDVIAFEGSMVDAWLAQDDLLRAPDAKDAPEAAARVGWLSLWNTAEMFAVMRYVVATQKTDKPIYFASMDIQPGMGGHPLKKQLLRRFIERVFDYAGEDVRGAAALAETLEPLRTCAGAQPPPKERVAAVERLSKSLGVAVAKVRARGGELWAMHADTMSLLPQMLEQRLSHCAEASGAGMGDDGKFNPGRYWVAYKEIRDRHQTSNVLGLRERVSRSHRVIVWGHHTHVAYQAAGAKAKGSIGGGLKVALPGETYALGLYAGSGRFIELKDGPNDGLIPRDVPAPGAPCCAGLDALRELDRGPNGFLLDLRLGRGSPDLAFAREPLGFPLEGDAARMTLVDEFDGVLFVPEVSEPTLVP